MKVGAGIGWVSGVKERHVHRSASPDSVVLGQSPVIRQGWLHFTKPPEPEIVTTGDPKQLRRLAVSSSPLTARQALLKLQQQASSNEEHELAPYQQVYGDLQGARLFLDKALTRIALEPNPEELEAARKTLESYQDGVALKALVNLRDKPKMDPAWSEEPTQESVSRLLQEPDLHLYPSKLSRLGDWLKREDSKELLGPHLRTLTHLAQPWEPTRHRESRVFFYQELLKKFPEVADADFICRELVPLAVTGSGAIAQDLILSQWEERPELVLPTMEAWTRAPHQARPNYADFRLLQNAIQEHGWIPEGRTLEKVASFTLADDEGSRGHFYSILAEVEQRRPGHLNDLQLPVDGKMLPLREALLAQVVGSEEIQLEFIKGKAEPALKLALADPELAARMQRQVEESYATGQPTGAARNTLAVLVHHGDTEPLFGLFHDQLREVQTDSREQQVFDRLRRRVVSEGMKDLKDKPFCWPVLKDLLKVNSSMHRLNVLPTGTSPMALDAADRYDEEWWHRRVFEKLPEIPAHHPIVNQLWNEISTRPYSRETLPEVQLLDFVTGRDKAMSEQMFQWLEPQLPNLQFDREDIHRHLAKKIVGAEIRRQRDQYSSTERSPEERLACLDRAIELDCSPVNGGAQKYRVEWQQECFLKSLEVDTDFRPLLDENPAVSVERYRAAVATGLPWPDACERVGKRILAGEQIDKPLKDIDFDLGVDYVVVGDFELDRLSHGS